MSTSSSKGAKLIIVRGELAYFRVLRLSTAFTMAMLLAHLADRPLAFLTPVLVAAMLSLPLPGLSLQRAFRHMLDTLIGFSCGATLALIFLPYPLVYSLLLATALFYTYYLFNRGASLWLVMMLLMSLLIMPLLRLQHQQLALGVLFEFVVFAWLAICLIYLSHLLWPDPGGKTATITRELKEYTPEAALAAVKSTLVVLPLALLFISFQWTAQILVLVFVALFTLSADLQKGWQAAQNSIISTLLGGAAAYLFYGLLVAVPDFHFFMVLNLLTVLLFAQHIFSAARISAYLGSALTTLVLLVNTSMGNGADFTGAFLTRLSLIVLAAFYVVFAFTAINHVVRRKRLAPNISALTRSNKDVGQ